MTSGPRRINHAHKADENQTLLVFFRIQMFRLGIEFLDAQSQHAQRLFTHGPVCVEDVLPAFPVHGQDFVVDEDAVTPVEQHIRRAFGHEPEDFSERMDRGHELASGIKGNLRHPRMPAFLAVLVVPLAFGELHQRRFRGIAHPDRHPGVRWGGPGIVAQHEPVHEQLLAGVVAVEGGHRLQRAVHVHFLDRHAVLGQRAGFVRTDDLCAAQGFHRGQLADDGIAACHFLHTLAQNDGHIGRHSSGRRHRVRLTAVQTFP
jgi:hypothetical protein